MAIPQSKESAIEAIEIKYRYKIQLEQMVHKHIIEEIEMARKAGLKFFRRF
jgi:hypothetical protein